MKNFISLGAGVQSSVMSLMAAHGEITPMPDGAVFADTKAETREVYAWLDWLEAKLPFPVHRVCRHEAGMMAEMLLVRRGGKNGSWAKSLIPAYVKNPDGTSGIMRRVCTVDWKITPIIKLLKLKAAVKRGEKEIQVIQWLGISVDEAHRMKPAQKPWIQNRFPLVEMRMRRDDCLAWMSRNGYPQPPRSSCFFCPYRSNAEWRHLKVKDPEAFQAAIKFEAQLQIAKKGCMTRTPFLHRSLVPLGEVPLGEDQMDFWGNECTGMCGV